MDGSDDAQFEQALAYDGTVVPRYARRFGDPMLAALRFGPRPNVLDLACRTGYPALQILQMAPDGRVIALDRDPRYLELARARAGADTGRRVFFKQGAGVTLRFGAEVFSHAVCNLLDRVTVDRPTALAEVSRVLLPGAQLAYSLPLQGSFIEPMDMLREVATRYDLARVGERVEQYATTLPTSELLEGELGALGFTRVAIETFSFGLDYTSAADLFADPVIFHAALADWRWCVEAAPDPDGVLVAMRHALDTYSGGGGFSVSVVGAVVSAFKP